MQALEQLADGPVVRDRVGHGAHSLEPKAAGSVGGEDAAAVGVGAVGVLGVVVAGVVGLPDVNRGAGDGPALHVFERAAHQAQLALAVRADGVAVGELAGIVGVERAQHGALGGAWRLWVVDVLDQRRQAQHVRQQDEFLSPSQKSRSFPTRSPVAPTRSSVVPTRSPPAATRPHSPPLVSTRPLLVPNLSALIPYLAGV